MLRLDMRRQQQEYYILSSTGSHCSRKQLVMRDYNSQVNTTVVSSDNTLLRFTGRVL